MEYSEICFLWRCLAQETRDGVVIPNIWIVMMELAVTTERLIQKKLVPRSFEMSRSKFWNPAVEKSYQGSDVMAKTDAFSRALRNQVRAEKRRHGKEIKELVSTLENPTIPLDQREEMEARLALLRSYDPRRTVLVEAQFQTPSDEWLKAKTEKSIQRNAARGASQPVLTHEVVRAERQRTGKLRAASIHRDQGGADLPVVSRTEIRVGDAERRPKSTFSGRASPYGTPAATPSHQSQASRTWGHRRSESQNVSEATPSGCARSSGGPVFGHRTSRDEQTRGRSRSGKRGGARGQPAASWMDSHEVRDRLHQKSSRIRWNRGNER